MNDYEIIVGTDETDDRELAVAKAALIVKEVYGDASVWRVDIYDGGGVGLNINTSREVAVSDNEFFESVEPVVVTEVEK